MKAAIIQHEASTPSGTTIDWLKKNKIEFTEYKIFEKIEFPKISDFDLLVICGGSMNVDQEEKYPWLTTEKKLVQDCLAQNKKMLGLCLGGQLIAEALGAKVGRHPVSELGWQSVDLLENNNFKWSAKTLSVFQYHSYAFELPKNAERLATNGTCLNQAFISEKTALGFQFHPESTAQWVKECSQDKVLPEGPYCQTREQMLAQIDDQKLLQAWYIECLDRWMGL